MSLILSPFLLNCHNLGVTIGGVFDRVLDLLTQLGTTSNYSAITDFHISQITNANTNSSPAHSVFNSRSLATDVNGGDSSACHAQVLFSSEYLVTELSQFSSCPGVLVI
jgi:hypothetical protein